VHDIALAMAGDSFVEESLSRLVREAGLFVCAHFTSGISSQRFPCIEWKLVGKGKRMDAWENNFLILAAFFTI
jgi:hypothetical protein